MIAEAEMGVSQCVLGLSHRGCPGRVTRDVAGYRLGSPKVHEVGTLAVQLEWM